MYAIKFRKVGDKAFWFATPDGYGNRKKIFAAVFPTREKAQSSIDAVANHNPDLEFKVVKL